MKEKYDICVLAPFYNEEEIIHSTIEKLLIATKENNKSFFLLLYDDCSTDKTEKKVIEYCNLKKIDFEIINSSNENIGHGAALYELKNYYEKNINSDLVLTIDSDLDVNTKDFSAFLGLANVHKLIIGKRNRGRDGLVRTFISTSLEIMVLINTGKYFKDVNCPIRIYSKDIYTELWGSIHKNSKVPNIVLSLFILKNKVDGKRGKLKVETTKKNSGSTWESTNLLKKYKKLFNFCIKAYKEVFKNNSN